MAVSKVNLLVPNIGSKMTVRHSSGMSFGSWKFDNYKKAFLSSLKPAEAVKTQYKKIFLFISIPLLSLTAYTSYKDHQKHHEHGRQEHVAYDYLNIRKKAFPFNDGNHTLFHNPESQYVPGVGYEKDPHH